MTRTNATLSCVGVYCYKIGRDRNDRLRAASLGLTLNLPLSLHSPIAPSQLANRFRGWFQFVFSGDPLIRFIRCLDPITRFWQENHDRKLEITGTIAERRAKILYRLAKAKLVRHRVFHSKRDTRALCWRSEFGTVMQKGE